MTDEIGTPVAPSGGEPVTAQPEPAPQGTPEDAAVLKARLEEKESFIGRQSKEIGDLRSAYQQLRTMVEAKQLERQQEPEPEPPPQTGQSAFSWDNPVDSVNRIVEERLRQADGFRAKQEADRRAAEARANFFEGKDAAFKGADKRLYEGIEDQVAQLVQQSYVNGVINERSLANPKTWQKAAQLFWLEKGDFSRLTPQPIQPTKATPTETPTGRPMATGEFTVEIDDETRRWGREQGLTDKQIEELVEGEMRAKVQGKNKATRSY